MIRTVLLTFGRSGQLLAAGLLALALSGCVNLFAPAKIQEEPIVAADILYQQALDDMDALRFNPAIETLTKLERQHPGSIYAERAKMMQIYAFYRTGQYDKAVTAANRYIALYPASDQIPYALYIKGNSYYGQIRDITRDQQFSRDAIDTYTLILTNYPRSEYADDAQQRIDVARDQLAGKEMSVGRYYLGNGQQLAAINRFRVVVEDYDTTMHIEEALYRLTEAYLQLGLINEAKSAAAVLGHNYPASTWYGSAVSLLQREGLVPELIAGNWIAAAQSG